MYDAPASPKLIMRRLRSYDILEAGDPLPGRPADAVIIVVQLERRMRIHQPKTCRNKEQHSKKRHFLRRSALRTGGKTRCNPSPAHASVSCGAPRSRMPVINCS